MSMPRDPHPPIFVIGSTRSGTTMLGRVLGGLPGMVYWHEPKTVSRIGHAYRSHDRATPKDATKVATHHIRRAMLRFQREGGDARVVEKNPRNAAKVAFLHAVFPEAKFIHIYRDGRAMLSSQFEQLDTFKPFNLGKRSTLGFIKKRLKNTPWWEWPAYISYFAVPVFRRHVLREPKTQWFGLKYPGWKADLAAKRDRIEIVAKQWTHALGYALDDIETLPEGVCLNLRYEEVVSDPERWLRTICEFCSIDVTDDVIREAAAPVHVTSVDKWKDELDAETIARATELMRPTLERLGYQPDFDSSKNTPE